MEISKGTINGIIPNKNHVKRKNSIEQKFRKIAKLLRNEKGIIENLCAYEKNTFNEALLKSANWMEKAHSN